MDCEGVIVIFFFAVEKKKDDCGSFFLYILFVGVEF